MSWERNIVIKSPQEVATLREAGRINARALDAVRQLIRPGVTTAELDAAAEEVIRKHGAVPTFKGYPGPYPYPASICVSINEQLVHGIPGKRKLQAGDVVSIDCGSTFEGFVGDFCFHHRCWRGISSSPTADRNHRAGTLYRHQADAGE